MASAEVAIDGKYYEAEANGVARFEYPFRKNGDRVSALFEQEYWQRASTYVPSELKAQHETHRGFYLIAESEPEDVIPGGGLYRFVRTYARVPRTQTSDASRIISKPELSGDFPRLINGVMLDQPDPNIPEWTFVSQTTIESDSGAPTYGITGGTYTVTFDGDTTAGIAYNASAATLQTALNGLASVMAYGSVTVTGSNTAGFTITWATYAATTVDASSLAATGARLFTPLVNSGRSQRVIIQPVWDDGEYSVDSSSLTPASVHPLRTMGGNGQIFTVLNEGPTGVRPPTGGTFTLTGYGQTTAAIAYNASIADVRTALDLLSEFTDRGGAYVTGLPLSHSIGELNISVLGQPALTSGTFTLTFDGDTTSTIAYNASISTISTAVNALASVTARGGATISGAGFAGGKQDFTITFANIPAMTGSAASLTPSGASIFVAATSSWGLANTISFTQNPTALRYLQAIGHGITTSDNIYVDSTLVESGGFTVPDANTIALNSTSGLLNSATTFTSIGIGTDRVYDAGRPPNIPIKLVTYFYLPGVTAGIDTVDDVPLPTRGTTSELLGAIFGGTTTFIYEVGEMSDWRDSPIKMLQITTINPQHLL